MEGLWLIKNSQVKKLECRPAGKPKCRQVTEKVDKKKTKNVNFWGDEIWFSSRFLFVNL